MYTRQPVYCMSMSVLEKQNGLSVAMLSLKKTHNKKAKKDTIREISELEKHETKLKSLLYAKTNKEFFERQNNNLD